jgi:uncharacterized protein RhaS with RHS repeats
LSEDPIQFGGGINFYGYVGNNATNRTDPDGTAFKTCAQALADLANASSRLAWRLGEINYWVARGRYPDATHLKELQIAIDNVNWAIGQVEKYCKCAAYLAAAQAAIGYATILLGEAAPYLAAAGAL